MTPTNLLFEKYTNKTLDNVETREMITHCGFYAPTSNCKTGFILLDNSDNICYNGEVFASQEIILEKLWPYAGLFFEQEGFATKAFSN